MKQLLPALLCITLFSCNKQKINNGPILPKATGSIQYKINDTLVTIDNTLTNQNITFEKLSYLPMEYRLIAGKADNTIFINFTTDSLMVNTYRDSFEVRNPAFNFSALFHFHDLDIRQIGDHFTVNISSYNNGRVSGTFSGHLSGYIPETSTGTLSNVYIGPEVVTEGVINNIHVTYP